MWKDISSTAKYETLRESVKFKRFHINFVYSAEKYNYATFFLSTKTK